MTAPLRNELFRLNVSLPHSRHARRICRARCLLAKAAIVAVVAVGGCRSSGTAQGGSGDASNASVGRVGPIDLVQVRAQSMAAADTYTTIIAQAADELRLKTKRAEVAEWALQQRIAAALASYTNATGANDFVSLLDMLVLVKLKRHAVEDHWIPNLLHEDEGAPLLEAFRRGEHDVWQMGNKSLSRAQLEQLRSLVDLWRRDNPTQYYVSHIRFSDFAASMRVSADSPQVKIPGNVFGLLYIDPLAGLDPVTRELRNYRALTERMVFLAARMPIVFAWQADMLTQRATGGPQIVAFVESTARFADATTQVSAATTQTAAAISRTADAVAKVPQDLAAERKAAIEQLDAVVAGQRRAALDQTIAGVDAQRVAMTRDVEAQQGKLRQLVADVKGVVERADQAGTSINTATGQTVTTTELSARRTLQLAFRLTLILILVLLAGIPLSLLLYRLAVRRWVVSTRTGHRAALE